MEAISLVHRPLVILPEDSGRTAGVQISLGAEYFGLIEKDFILFVNGRAVHPDDYIVDPSDSGIITLGFPTQEETVITATVWQ